MQGSVTRWLFEQKKELSQKIPELFFYFVEVTDKNGDRIPFLPIGNFRKFHIFQNHEAEKTFHSSGSTNAVRARHSFSKAGLHRYEVNCAQNFRFFLASLGIAADAPIISLIPPTSQWQQSSLAAMIEMFSRQGLNVKYFPVPKAGASKDIIIFGTSFHHLLLQNDPRIQDLQAFIKDKNLTVIDTGGTKGRTKDYSLEEVHRIIRETYPDSKKLNFVSEYGMCELASQAYSLHSPHDGWFKTNNTLTPFIVDLDKKRIVTSSNEVGFLAFVDEGNVDSFGAIITEDLAFMDPKRPTCFKLVGRAPDASVKGCSLNVKYNFTATTSPHPTQVFLAPSTMRPLKEITELVESLSDDDWDACSKQDLKDSLRSIDSQNLEQNRFGQRIMIILSANIPITFLYPAFICKFRGVKELHLKLPSLRSGDPLSQIIRRQITSLANVISPFLLPMQIIVHEDQDLSFSRLEEFDAVLVFGSDETIATIRESISSQSETEIIGLGSIANALVVVSQSLDLASHACSKWFGRGCLTPLALVTDEETFLVSAFAASFEALFEQRIRAYQVQNHFSHRHKILETEALLSSLDLDPSSVIYKSKHTFVVDLRTLTCDLTQDLLPIESGGFGLVFVINHAQLAQLNFKTYSPDPSFGDPHMGKLWTDWL